jgi:hypothetical protein
MALKKYNVEVPDGQHLGLSRDTDGAYRAHLFDDESNDLVGHAELFVPEEDEADAANLQDVYVWDARRTESDEEPDELALALGNLVALGIIAAAMAAAPHISRWWNNKTLPVFKPTRDRIESTWNRIAKPRKADSRVAPAELIILSDPTPGDAADIVDAALEGLRASMSSAEARQRLVAALMAAAFIEEQLGILRNTRIEDEEGPLEFESAMHALTPQQIGDSVNLMLEKDPSLLDRETLAGIGKILDRGRSDGEFVPLRRDVLLRLTNVEL